MNPKSPPPLNQDQQAAAEGFFQFLLSKDKEFIISGPGGVGKTFLLSHLIDVVIPRYREACRLLGINPIYDEVCMTALTNKAVEVLYTATKEPSQTIHSLLNLRVKDDYKTGRSELIPTNNYKILYTKIIFIDEASMIDYPLLKMIRDTTQDCKIIYVGDHCQLPPIKEPVSPVYSRDLPLFELKQQMRNSGQPALMNVCQQLRDTVETGVFNPIQLVPGVIDHLDDAQMEQEIEHYFKVPSNNRILAYTNQRVVEYNNYIRELRQLKGTYVVGERLINNSAIQLHDRMIPIEKELQISWLSKNVKPIEIEDGVHLEVRYADLRAKYVTYLNIPLPEDREHFSALLKHYAKTKNWKKYFHLKNTYPDLRPKDAITIHKSQGSTYDNVFIDLSNLSTCHNKNLAARLLYVAFSRASKRVFLYGDLAPKYGGLIE